MAGYVGIGIPCGIMEQQIGMSAIMAFAMSMTFYSGAGQFMIPSMWLAGNPIASIIASVSFVNTRQMLYSAAFSPYFERVNRLLTFLFSATVTDESFGVNLAKYQEGSWDAGRATLVNLLCMTTWSLANAAGVLVGGALAIPTAIAAFAMTSIFICLLVSRKFDRTTVVVVVGSIAGVVLFKAIGLSGPAILLGAICGVASGLVADRRW
ncbi:MAG: AzlC family ABC transporter permease, partial [Eggerthellaceae bacterium]|nr:AzlC family ABC transporter permease [Eggerthellaceae bacterium]